jgi:transmembrane sensor
MPPEHFDDPTDELLFRFIAERCSTSERGIVEGWLRRDPANARRLDDTRRIWLASRPAPLRDVDRMWTRLRAAAEGEAMERSGESPVAPGGDRARPAPRAASLRWPTRTFPAATWAAAAVVLATGAALLFSLSHVSVPARPAVPPRVYATGRGQTANVRLADGTRVTLAPQTRLTVPDDFGGAERSVTIEGQALFDVVHDAAHPFRVDARGTAAQDIGTRFEMSAYADEPAVTVIVAEGAVTFGHVAAGAAQQDAEGVVVSRGERATAGAGNTITVDRVPASLVGWTDGHLAFVKTPLAEIARTIGRWYDLDVQIADDALQRRLVTADFDTQSPNEMIAALATAVGAQVERHGRVLVIRPAP